MIHTYKRVISNRYWDDKMYLFPIPDSEIRKNPNLIQNPKLVIVNIVE